MSTSANNVLPSDGTTTLYTGTVKGGRRHGRSAKKSAKKCSKAAVRHTKKVKAAYKKFLKLSKKMVRGGAEPLPSSGTTGLYTGSVTGGKGKGKGSHKGSSKASARHTKKVKAAYEKFLKLSKRRVGGAQIDVKDETPLSEICGAIETEDTNEFMNRGEEETQEDEIKQGEAVSALNEEEQEAEDTSAGGGGRFKKGSLAAKQFMARLRSMRHKKHHGKRHTHSRRRSHRHHGRRRDD